MKSAIIKWSSSQICASCNLKTNQINIKHDKVEYTYFREHYGLRIDRMYVGDLKDKITSIIVKPVSFSDHSSVITEIKLDCNFNLGKFYCKLNTKLLELEDIQEEFDVWELPALQHNPRRATKGKTEKFQN